MRIAIFSDAYHPLVSGQVYSMDEFSRSFTDHGHEVCIVCPSYPKRRMRGAVDLFPTIRVPSGTAFVSKRDRLAYPWHHRRTMRKVDKFKPDVVHVQTEFSVGAMGRKYCKQRNLPIFSTCHTHYEMYMKSYLPLLPRAISKSVVRLWLRAVYKNDRLIIVPSQRILSVLRSYGIVTESALIPTGVDERIFKPCPEEARSFRKELAKRHPGFDTGLLMVYVGRMEEEKNLNLLGEAMAAVMRQIPDARFIAVGDGSGKHELHRFFRRQGLEKRIALLGFLEREKLPAVYSAADVFTFPSATETQGLVTIEAMLCGTPVVGVNKMGTGEIMAGDRGGFLAEDNAEDFAQKVISLLRDPELRARKSMDALGHAQKWSIANASESMEREYRRIFEVTGDM
ncbi:MAG: glycosyltransferase [Spirochaetia bacterium]|nr:glycosyltransferase [Spirochaetia bacterium]